MKRNLLIFFLLISAKMLNAQNTNTFPGTGNVGIGTVNPLSLLDIHGMEPSLTFSNPGSQGIVSGTLLGTINWNEDDNSAGRVRETSAYLRQISTGTWTSTASQSYLGFGIRNSSSNFLDDAMVLTSDGNIGIGTTTPATALEVKGGSVQITNPAGYPYGYNLNVDYASGWAREYGISYNGTGKLFAFGVKGNGANITYAYIGGNTTDPTASNSSWMNFLPNGNVLIGKNSQTNSGYKLDVAGNVRADKIVVNTTGADYVFDSTYKLMSLDDVEKFIQQNSHLPEINSADSMQNNGLDVGKNQIKLLQKIEELTLYIIAQNKQIDEQTRQIDKQSELVKNLMQLVGKQQQQINILSAKIVK